MPTRQRYYGDQTIHMDVDWEKITHSLNPETKDLPEEDRNFFESKVKLLIGKEIRLSNIPAKRFYLYIQRLKWVVRVLRYPQLFPRDYQRYEIVQLLFRLGLPISIDGLGWKYGPMGFQHTQQLVEQKLVEIPLESK